MKILVHFPTKGRKEQAEYTLREYMARCENPDEVTYSLACNSDEDAPDMDIVPTVANFRSKIEAYNAIPIYLHWDILVGASDDMWCVQNGWDTIIREAMEKNFPDTDGCLWFHDGSSQTDICTLPIMGREYYERTGYLYHPSYRSFWSDNEQTEVAYDAHKLYKDPRCLFKHQHPVWGGVMPIDRTYSEKSRDFQRDKRNFFYRKRKGFPSEI